MKKRLIILILLALTAIGGKMLPTETPSTPAPQLSGETPQLVGTVLFDMRATSVKIADGLSTVIRVVDGDTIIVEIDEGASRQNDLRDTIPQNRIIRLIGVDTPEVVDSRKTVECFGKEASEFTKNLLLGKRVRLESDPTQGDRDKYGRLLRYVFLPDGMLVNKTIITEGYGHEYTYRMPYRYQDDFKTAERTARETGKGLWASGVCGLQNTN